MRQKTHNTLAKSRTYIKRIDPKVPRVSSWPLPLWEQPPMCGQITDFGFFEKNDFFIFWSLKKSFFVFILGSKTFSWLPYPFLASKIMVFGRHISCIFLSEKIFWVHFAKKVPNTKAQIHKTRGVKLLKLEFHGAK